MQTESTRADSQALERLNESKRGLALSLNQFYFNSVPIIVFFKASCISSASRFLCLC